MVSGAGAKRPAQSALNFNEQNDYSNRVGSDENALIETIAGMRYFEGSGVQVLPAHRRSNTLLDSSLLSFNNSMEGGMEDGGLVVNQDIRGDNSFLHLQGSGSKSKPFTLEGNAFNFGGMNEPGFEGGKAKAADQQPTTANDGE